MAKRLGYSKYKITLEAVTDFCICANEDSVLESKDYVVHGKYAYVLKTQALSRLIKGENFENDFKAIENIGTILEQRPDLAEKYLEDSRLQFAKPYGNRLNVNRFWRFLSVEGDKVAEKYAVPASTLKGILKTGFFSYFIDKVNYSYGRDKTGHLLLKNVQAQIINSSESFSANNLEEFYKNLISAKAFSDGFEVYVPQKSDKSVVWVKKEDISETIKSSDKLFFKNLVCSDLRLQNGNAIIKKVDRVSRKNNKNGPPQYFELIQPSSRFIGEVKILNHLPKDTAGDKLWTTLISVFYKDQKDSQLDLMKICTEGLKKFSINLIEAEKKSFLQKLSALNPKNATFYDRLLSMVNEGDIVIKIGKSGVMAKSFMVLDKQNLSSKDDFAPYTINVEDCNQTPIGWVKLKIEEIRGR